MSRLHRQKLRLRAGQRDAGVIDGADDELDREAFQEVGTGSELRELRAERPQALRQAVSEALRLPVTASTPEAPPPQDAFAASLQAFMARGLTLQQAVDSVFGEYKRAAAETPSQLDPAPAVAQPAPLDPAQQPPAPVPAQNPVPSEPPPDVPRPAPDSAQST